MTTLRALRALSAEDAQTLGVTHTLREILQQPRLWLETARQLDDRHADGARFWQLAGMDGPSRPEVVLIGAGSSDFVAQLVAPAFRARFGVVTQALASTDLLTQVSALLLPERRYLFVWFSRSGDTPEAVELFPELERRFAGSHHLVITCNAGGALVRVAPSPRSSIFTLPDACNDRGLAMTSSFTCMALAGLLLALGDAHVAPVAELALSAERVFDGADSLSELAQRSLSSACFLGSGALKAAAAESALKLTELSAGRVKTRSDSFLGVRHGPLASLDKDALLVGLLSREPEERAYELELVRDVRNKALAGVILLVTPAEDARARELADITINLGLTTQVPEALRPLLDVTVGQLLALFSSLAHGARPDAPSSNGAIARVVTSIRPQDAARGAAGR